MNVFLCSPVYSEFDVNISARFTDGENICTVGSIKDTRLKHDTDYGGETSFEGHPPQKQKCTAGGDARLSIAATAADVQLFEAGEARKM